MPAGDIPRWKEAFLNKGWSPLDRLRSLHEELRRVPMGGRGDITDGLADIIEELAANGQLSEDE